MAQHPRSEPNRKSAGRAETTPPEAAPRAQHATGGATGHAHAHERAGRSGKHNIVHVTHEAIEQLGGIGTVLEGMITSPVYQAAAGRTVLVGPLPHADRAVRDPRERLGPWALKCRYSGPEHFDPEGLGALLRPIEWSFGVKLVYGTRRYHAELESVGGASAGAEGGGGRTAEAEVLLIDVTSPNRERLGAFKWMLFERFGIDSRLYEHGWDYEEWCRLADPAYHALVALGVGGGSGSSGGVSADPAGGTPISATTNPTIVISHEFMGMCTALRCMMDRTRFRAAFHAHECSTARRIVEHLPGHDVAFYPAMRHAMREGRYVEDVFGSQADFSRHALVSQTHLLDSVLAVGPETAEELRFLSPRMAQANLHVAYNGLPAPRVTFEQKQRSRTLVWKYLKQIGVADGWKGAEPDYLITHVTRPVISKGLWRDAKLLAHLEKHLRAAGKRAVYLLLTCGAPIRSFDQASAMTRDHQWPVKHREGYPDLDGPETGIWRMLEGLEKHAAALHKDSTPAVRTIMVNQFGFTRERLGEAAPEGMTLHDLRAAADVELGMSVYEPYGIAHLEALHAGAVCVPSTVCGCLGLVKRAMGELGMQPGRGPGECPLVLPADFTQVNVTDPAHFSSHQRDVLEEQVCAALADELWQRLPRSDEDRRRYLELGQRLATRMGWDAVCERDVLPALGIKVTA